MAQEPVDMLSPKNDFVFKQIFGDAKRPEPLKAFLQAALGFPEDEFSVLSVVDPSLNPEFENDKLCILDVRVRTSSGKEVDIEIQVQPSEGLYNRIQCYTAKMLANQVKSGEKYSVVAQVITIVIADFAMWKQNAEYHHRFCLYEPDRKFAYPNSMEIHTLELPKLPENADGTALWGWLKFISSGTRDEFESLAEKDTIMASAYARLAELSADETARLRAEAHDKWVWDNNSRMRESRESGLAEGLARGKAEGLAEGKAEVIRQMLRENIPLSQISQWTKVPLPEIERISAECKLSGTC